MPRINPHVKLKLMKKSGFKCVYCGHKGDRSNYLTLDHVVPLAKGGSNRQSNLVCSCRKCNGEKDDKLLTEFIKDANIEISRELAEFL